MVTVAWLASNADDNSITQQALAGDPEFRKRVVNGLVVASYFVITEDPDTLPAQVSPVTKAGLHAARATLAHQILAGVAAYANQVVETLVTLPQIVYFPTGYDFQAKCVVTGAADSDIKDALLAVWSSLPGFVAPTA